MSKINKAVVTGLFLMFLVGAGFAQIRISSPYSRYGLGDLIGNRYSRSLASGGVGYAFRDSLALNVQNPASYTVFDSTSFICEVGLSSQWSGLQTFTNVQSFNNLTTLGYLTFGFPITRWCGASVGLIPYSQVGYKLLVEDSIDGAGYTNHQYKGYGSLNRFYIGSGFKVHRDLSLGFNVSFMFGTLNNIKSVYFKDLTYVFDTRMTDVLVINDFHFEAGLQYHHSFKKRYFLNAGLMSQIPYNMNARKSFAVERFVTSSTTGAEVTRDTVHFDDNVKGKIHLPLGIGGGVAFGVKNFWTIELDAAWQNWDKYTTFGNADSLTSGLKAGFGFSVTPPHSSVSSYLKKIAYRGGARYENTYLDIHGHQIAEYAFSLGFGFPFRKTGSSINLSFEIGQRGMTRDDLIKETFVRGVLGLSIKEKWFTRRKLD